MTIEDKEKYIKERRADLAAAIQSGGIQYKGDSVRAGITLWEFLLPDEMFLPDPMWGY
jgi:hypothetical protein